MGSKGRNISLVRKYSGMAIFIRAKDVCMMPQRNKPDALLALKLSLSASTGGVLRWFVTPQATRDGYPEHIVPLLKRAAYDHECDLEVMRSRRGHVCIMLVPRLFQHHHTASDAANLIDNEETKTEEINRFRPLLRMARERLMQIFATIIPVDTPVATAAESSRSDI